MAGRGQYTSGFPLSEVRMRNWPAGKVAALKRVVSLLENQLNTTMAAQVNQGGARKFNSRVPKVTGLVVKSGFKNFTLTFNDAKGIDDLLFYEIQKDSSSSFSNPTTFTIPQTTLTIPTTAEHEKVFFRIRCLNSQFECGPWSATASGTGSSNFRINITRQDRVVVSLPWDSGANLGVWQDICGVTYTPSTASACLNIQAGVYMQNSNETNHDGDSLPNVDAYDFRLLRNGVIYTNAGQFHTFTTSTYTYSIGGAAERRTEEVRMTSMVTPFESFTSQDEPVTYTLQARNNNIDFVPERSKATDPSIIIVDNFDIMEVVQSF